MDTPPPSRPGSVSHDDAATPAPTATPPLPVRCEGALSLVRVHGSWAGALPEYGFARTALSDDGETARFEFLEYVCEMNLRDGSVHDLAGFSPRHAQVELAVIARSPRLSRRGADARSWLVASCARTEGLDTPRYAQVRLYSSTGRRQRARVVEAETGRAVLRYPLRRPTSFSPCGSLFAVYSRTARVVTVTDLDARSSRTIALPARLRARTIALGPGGRILVAQHTTDEGRPALSLFDLADGALRWTLALDARPTLFARDPVTGEALVYCSGDGRVEALRLSDGSPARHLTTAAGTLEAVTRDGRYALVIDHDAQSVSRIAVETGEARAFDANAGGAVVALAWDRSSARYAMLTSAGKLRVFTQGSREPVYAAEVSSALADNVEGCALALLSGREEALVARVDASGADDTTVLERVSLVDGCTLASEPIARGGCAALVPSRDGAYVWIVCAYALHDGSGRRGYTAQLRSTDLARTLHTHHSEGDLATCDPLVGFVDDERDGAPQALWLTIPRYELARLRLDGRGVERTYTCDQGAALSFDPPYASLSEDGTSVFTLGRLEGGDGEALLVRSTAPEGSWRRANRADLEGLEGAWNELHSFANTLACARGDDGVVRLYSLKSHDGSRDGLLGSVVLMAAHDEVTCLALAPDERTLLVGTRVGVLLELAVAPHRAAARENTRPV